MVKFAEFTSKIRVASCSLDHSGASFFLVEPEERRALCGLIGESEERPTGENITGVSKS
jgi:hypothetical protein